MALGTFVHNDGFSPLCTFAVILAYTGDKTGRAADYTAQQGSDNRNHGADSRPCGCTANGSQTGVIIFCHGFPTLISLDFTV